MKDKIFGGVKKAFSFVVLSVLLLAASTALAQTVTVSGDLKDVLGAQVPGVSGQTFVRFSLLGWSGNVPKVSETGLIATYQLRSDVIPDSTTGHFSTSVFGNDSVTPSNTYYRVEFWANGRLVTSGNYLFTASACPSGCNLDTYGQINPAPTPPINIAPFLGTNNTFTGTNTFNGAVTFNSTVGFGLGAQTFQTPRFVPPITISTTNPYTWNFTNPAAARSISWPDPGANDTIAFLNATQTFLNKTLDTAAGNALKVNGNTLAAAAGSATVTLPNSTDTLVGRNTTDTLANKTLGSGTSFSASTAATTGALGTIHLPSVTVLTSGSGTYTTPAGATMLHVRIVGGGGGGSGSGSGAGNGVSGGNTTFGTSLYTANGGSGGVFATGSGGGGSASGGTINVTGGTGGFPNQNQTFAGGGSGGVSFFGGGGQGAGQAPGSGGAGGSSGGTAVVIGAGGGAGGYVEGWITAPGASYAYSVGTSGGGGTAGTSGVVGSAGAAGLIIVESY